MYNLALVHRPRMFVANGHWPQGREAAEILERSWLRIFRGVVDAARYTRALCLHLEGKFDESLQVLATVRSTKQMRYAALTLEAGNLVLLGRDAERVEALLDEARLHKVLPEDLLLLALAKLSLGKRGEAESFFASAGTTRPELDGPLINDPVFHYLRAMYLIKTGRAADSIADLVAASHAKQNSIYVDRARELLPRAPNSEDDAPSSLGPHVLGDG
jgi:hypothetical protein